MKNFVVIATLFFSLQTWAQEPASIVIEDSAKIADVLAFYPAFSNKVFAQGAAFGFTPSVKSVNAEFEMTMLNFEEVCEIKLTAEMASGSMKSAVPPGVINPEQIYHHAGDCDSAMGMAIFDI